MFQRRKERMAPSNCPSPRCTNSQPIAAQFHRVESSDVNLVLIGDFSAANCEALPLPRQRSSQLFVRLEVVFDFYARPTSILPFCKLQLSLFLDTVKKKHSAF